MITVYYFVVWFSVAASKQKRDEHKSTRFQTSTPVGLSSYRVDPTEDGDYRLCFDNSFSKLSEKLVFFEVIINSQSSASRGRDEWADVATAESLVGYKLEDVWVRERETKSCRTYSHGLR